MPADFVRMHSQVGVDPRRNALILAQEAKGQVLGAEVVVVEATGFVLREYHDLVGALRKSFELGIRPPRYSRRPVQPSACGSASMS